MPNFISKLNRKNARRPVSRVLSLPRGRGWPFIWDARCRAPRATDPDGGVKTRLPAVSYARGSGRPSLLGLAPGGVCPAAPVTGGAGRSYRPVSPLPAPVGWPAVCFLWHFPWGRPRRALPGTVFPWSPDFPPPARACKRTERKAAIRPSGALEGGPRAWRNQASRRAASAKRWRSRLRLSPSAVPSTRRGRKWRWKALTTAAVRAS